VELHLDDGARVVYTDPRRFGMMDLFGEGETAGHRLLRDIGVEPLGNGLNGDYLAKAFKGKAAPLKAALLDQSIIAGLGNIYVCEALFRAGLAPTRKAGTIASAARLDPLIRHIRDILGEAIRAGGSTLRDYAGADGSEGAFQQSFQAYGREGETCLKAGCTGMITRMVQSGRSTFHCPKCQR
jgi:formamidopyrimidine-DNA glycosylase